MRAKYRIGLATVATFVAIVGILAAIHGVLFDQESVIRYGAASVIAGLAAFVMLLNPLSGIDDESGNDRKK